MGNSLRKSRNRINSNLPNSIARISYLSAFLNPETLKTSGALFSEDGNKAFPFPTYLSDLIRAGCVLGCVLADCYVNMLNIVTWGFLPFDRYLSKATLQNSECITIYYFHYCICIYVLTDITLDLWVFRYSLCKAVSVQIFYVKKAIYLLSIITQVVPSFLYKCHRTRDLLI